MSNSLNFLGMARKAGKLEIGEEFTGAAVRLKKARVIILASDASENARRRAENFSKAGNVPLIELKYTKAELGRALDKASPAMAAITDIGFAAAFVERIADEGSDCGELAEELAAKAAKAKRRRRETLAGKRNARVGKRRKKV